VVDEIFRSDIGYCMGSGGMFVECSSFKYL